jgi:hypothetical protein
MLPPPRSSDLADDEEETAKRALFTPNKGSDFNKKYREGENLSYKVS